MFLLITINFDCTQACVVFVKRCRILHRGGFALYSKLSLAIIAMIMA